MTAGGHTRPRLSDLGAVEDAEMLERTLARYRNRAVETARVSEELIGLAKEMRAADRRGEDLGLSKDELAFYDALETSDSPSKRTPATGNDRGHETGHETAR